MEVTISPTGHVTSINGSHYSVWKGTTDKGQRCVVLVQAIHVEPNRGPERPFGHGQGIVPPVKRWTDRIADGLLASAMLVFLLFCWLSAWW